MNKKTKKLLILIIFIMIILLGINKSNADELIGMMKVYKLKINLMNMDTDRYTIELIDGISDKIFESQEGNETGEHNFAIATDMEINHLNYYQVIIKFKNGDVKKFDIDINKFKNIDDNESDSSYNFEYNIIVKIFSRNVIIGIAVIVAITGIVILIIYLKKHKKRIK